MPQKRIYVILPKRLNTKPKMKVNAGYAAAQAVHTAIEGTNRYHLSPYTTVIVLQVADEIALRKTSAKLSEVGISHCLYVDTVTRRKNQTAFTGIITQEIAGTLRCLRWKKRFE